MRPGTCGRNPRRTVPYRDPGLRIADFNEVYTYADDEKLRKQGARCMDCGIPFCHTGELISGMASGCPVNNLIPEWNDLTPDQKKLYIRQVEVFAAYTAYADHEIGRVVKAVEDCRNKC